MCNHLTVLAEHSERHYVMQCEHGTIHLVWGNQTLRLHAKDLCCLVELFRRWATQPDAPGMRAGGLCLFGTDGGGVQCWVGDGGLRLMPSDVGLFERLLCTADTALTMAQEAVERREGCLFGNAYRPLAPIPAAAVSVN